MDNTNTQATQLHTEINEWKEMVRLVRDETRIFENQLQSIVKFWDGSEAMKYVQKFESQFIRQREVSDEFEHDLKLADHNIREWMQQVHSGNVLSAPDHTLLRDKALTYQRLFLELRDDFRQFAAALQNARSLN
jgi:hypothetical protein